MLCISMGNVIGIEECGRLGDGIHFIALHYICGMIKGLYGNALDWKALYL